MSPAGDDPRTDTATSQRTGGRRKSRPSASRRRVVAIADQPLAPSVHAYCGGHGAGVPFSRSTRLLQFGSRRFARPARTTSLSPSANIRLIYCGSSIRRAEQMPPMAVAVLDVKGGLIFAPEDEPALLREKIACPQGTGPVNLRLRRRAGELGPSPIRSFSIRSLDWTRLAPGVSCAPATVRWWAAGASVYLTDAKRRPLDRGWRLAVSSRPSSRSKGLCPKASWKTHSSSWRQASPFSERVELDECPGTADSSPPGPRSVRNSRRRLPAAHICCRIPHLVAGGRSRRQQAGTRWRRGRPRLPSGRDDTVRGILQ